MKKLAIAAILLGGAALQQQPVSGHTTSVDIVPTSTLPAPAVIAPPVQTMTQTLSVTILDARLEE